MDELARIEYENALKGVIELAVPHAKAVKAYYNALVAEGFKEEQALRMVINHGYCPPSSSGHSDD